jgi:hypothetical protein
MPGESWKHLEREVAKKLGGERILRGADFSQRMGDVAHPTLGVECKYGGQVPKFFYDALEQCQEYGDLPPVVCSRRKGKKIVIAMYLDDFAKLFKRVLE